MRSDGIAGFSDGAFNGLAGMPPITLGDFLHHMIDCKFRGHFTTAVSSNAVSKHGKKHGRPIFSTENKRSYSVTVFIVLARHTRVRLSLNVQVSARGAYHEVDFFEVTFGSEAAGGRFRSKR